MSNHKLSHRCLTTALALVAGAGLLLTSRGGTFSIVEVGQPVLAQRIRPDNLWKTVYERLPEFPLENQYISTETGKAEPDNTLVNRLIRYHLYVKGRSPFYRLDWKLTLADYLGINEPIEEAVYPTRSKLRQSPLEGDVAVISRLNQAQRNALVQSLVDAFAPQAPRPTQAAPVPTPTPTPSPSPAAAPIRRGPGAAQLLQ